MGDLAVVVPLCKGFADRRRGLGFSFSFQFFIVLSIQSFVFCCHEFAAPTLTFLHSLQRSALSIIHIQVIRLKLEVIIEYKQSRESSATSICFSNKHGNIEEIAKCNRIFITQTRFIGSGFCTKLIKMHDGIFMVIFFVCFKSPFQLYLEIYVD